MTIRLFRSISLTCLIFSALILPLATFAQSATVFFIVGDVDCSQFPQVQFQLRAVDLNNQAVSNLNSSNISVYENGQIVPNIQVTPRNTDGPINYIFVVDQGRLANYTNFGLDRIRTAFTTLVSGGYFKDGIDRVMVMGRQNINSDKTITWLPVTQKGTELTTFIANFNFAKGTAATKGLLGVGDAVTQMASLVPVPGTETAVIIYITRWVEDPPGIAVVTDAAQLLGATAKAQNISIYVFQTDSSGTNKAPLQALTTAATGTHQILKGSTVVTDVSNVYQYINTQRTIYNVSYRSTSGQSGNRPITINSEQPSGSGRSGSCDITVTPPTVSISRPAEGSSILHDPAKPETNTTPIVGNISWTGNPRNIKSIQLIVNGQPEGGAFQPPEGKSDFELTWDLGDQNKPGTTPVNLQVKVIDELGVEVTTDIPVSVEVPIAATPTSTPIIRIPEKVDPVPIGIVLSTVCLGLLCAIPVSFLVFYVTRPVQAKKAIEDIRHTLIGGAPAKQKSLATLQVMEGPKGMIGEKLDLTKPITTIGRNPKMVDIVFYADEESSVSRLHCTIQLDGKTFKITDNNSTSGSRVNGRRLQPNDPTDLNDGDEITLGDLAKLGVKLRFGFLLDKTQLQSSGTASDRTMIIDDFDKDEWDKYKDN